jgi:hypothetical protein
MSTNNMIQYQRDAFNLHILENRGFSEGNDEIFQLTERIISAGSRKDQGKEMQTKKRKFRDSIHTKVWNEDSAVATARLRLVLRLHLDPQFLHFQTIFEWISSYAAELYKSGVDDVLQVVVSECASIFENLSSNVDKLCNSSNIEINVEQLSQYLESLTALASFNHNFIWMEDTVVLLNFQNCLWKIFQFLQQYSSSQTTSLLTLSLQSKLYASIDEIIKSILRNVCTIIKIFHFRIKNLQNEFTIIWQQRNTVFYQSLLHIFIPTLTMTLETSAISFITVHDKDTCIAVGSFVASYFFFNDQQDSLLRYCLIRNTPYQVTDTKSQFTSISPEENGEYHCLRQLPVLVKCSSIRSLLQLIDPSIGYLNDKLVLYEQIQIMLSIILSDYYDHFDCQLFALQMIDTWMQIVSQTISKHSGMKLQEVPFFLSMRRCCESLLSVLITLFDHSVRQVCGFFSIMICLY